MELKTNINDACDGVDLIVLPPGRAEAIARLFNEQNPNDNIDYRSFQIHRMAGTCDSCPRYFRVSARERYCLREIKKD